MGSHFELHVYVTEEKDVNLTANPGQVCFSSGWDISSSANVNLSGTQQIYCYKPDFNQICTTLFVNFSSGNCSEPFVKAIYINASGMSPFCLTWSSHTLRIFDCILCRRHLARCWSTCCLCAADFLNISEVHLEPPTGFPAAIEPKWPKSCESGHLQKFNLNYTCRGRYKLW